jgi:hypothetical protein
LSVIEDFLALMKIESALELTKGCHYGSQRNSNIKRCVPWHTCFFFLATFQILQQFFRSGCVAHRNHLQPQSYLKNGEVAEELATRHRLDERGVRES